MIIRSLTSDEFKPLFDKYKHDVFEHDHSYDLWNLLDQKEMSNVDRLSKNLGKPFKLYLAAFNDENEFVGWSWGLQENSTTFYMCNSAVRPEFRRRGVYSQLLRECIKTLSEEGFQLVYSKHCATNNSVIIPKLKAGFLISKMEIDDKFGVLIHLHYYFNKTRKRIINR